MGLSPKPSHRTRARVDRYAAALTKSDPGELSDATDTAAKLSEILVQPALRSIRARAVRRLVFIPAPGMAEIPEWPTTYMLSFHSRF